uniref:Uncharacterized protein n=1 Tax=Corethron hystrix TaxID=216773 RepID=A0A7S1BL01_9STRA|mmetsp:Transcript_32622/g.75090  ORF Transcript_32622/g.75090 Transcript_32622/m.75090 type:complete len:419 (+) Transcript_32622:145-1401(+)|eukprot:CAMPEP_0113305006 /NCGR_PEP_ID=MMETSP0010_2-20120614/4793_1 /TAXON_ID=216773 ORGANISM="Corethron hystrix, Strain 308" /NCGR_SAMPLE_ID=MMETSP0010_2 /ASSEMBLY_ACC=CAM_ASM_000155 /LENGTH=418 /DNA_ID=CAMNT_0000159313 /DNA_START=108 /DNA_END=1364 /DNA_ORIENTATION=+ /assembly_acc=CAM_ASM_000155
MSFSFVGLKKIYLPRRRHLCILFLLGLLEEVSICHADISLWKSNRQQSGPQGPGRAHRFGFSRPFSFLPLAWAGSPRGSASASASAVSSASSRRSCAPDDRSKTCRAALTSRGGNLPVDPPVPSLPLGLPLYLWKILFQVCLTSINVIFWLLPLRSPSFGSNALALSVANAFSGGVFLSLAFGHLIPECAVAFREGGVKDEALPHLAVLGGYLFIFFVEKVAFDAHGLLEEMQENDTPTPKGKGSGLKRTEESESSSANASSTKSSNSSRSAVILLGALAVHSVLEMMALGLSDSFADAALLSLSIALHQPAESIALLVAFLKSSLTKPEIVRYLSVFSACGPVGVAIGMAVNKYAPPIFDATMLAVVAGTFVYVGATEVIPEEWEDQEHKWKKFGSLLAGITAILVITKYTATLEGH